MAVPYTFGNATTSIPLSQLDTNFATAITIGNTAVQLGNTITTMNNLTLANVTISSGNVTVTKVTTPTVDAGSGNALTLQSNSTTGLYIDTSQNVGIGVTPSAFGSGFKALQMNGGSLMAYNGTNMYYLNNAYYDGTNYKYVTSSSATNYVQSSGIHVWSYAASGTAGATISFSEAMRIDSSGNVGIGTTNPQVKLQVVGTTAGGSAVAQPSVLRVGAGSLGTTVGNDINIGGFYASTIGNTSYLNTHIQRVASGSDWTTAAVGLSHDVDATVGAGGQLWFYNGNVGIGTSSPSQKLHVSSTSDSVILSSGGSGAGGYLAANGNGRSGLTGALKLLSYSSGVAEISNASNAAMLFSTNDTERMRIDSSGTLMLGTTSVNNGKANFVRSDNGDCVIQPYANSTTFNNDIIRAVTTRTSGTTEFLFLACYYNTYSSVRAYIRADGNMYNVNGTYGTISDVKLKENIVDATPKLNDLLQLKVRNFNFIDDELKIKQLGFVAQEVEQVFPNMVDVSREGNKTIKTSVLIPMLVKAIQELKAELDALKGTK